ncbi:liver-expressed antimicrobial peptide 2 [Esox lucius]|uniref:Liver-expressed antimicrobial peptide 2 n=1 Tax=Esox lucius TaxID=8010 RepID=A0AAY5K4X8_ESOLU|nr:liver-expressed antimicrobial peptide 2 [Esox lucius]
MHSPNYSKTIGVCLVSMILAHQLCASPIGSLDSVLSVHQGTKTLERKARTPLWRFIGTKPMGAYCRDHFECSTQICRRGHCALSHADHS